MWLAAAPVLLAQPALPPDASAIDWVPFADLSPAQQAELDANCCGRYVAPAFTPVPGAPGTLQIEATDQSGTEDGQVQLLGNVEVRQDDVIITADRGNYDRSAAIVTLQGNILIRQPGVLLTGTTATVDQNAATSELRNASYVLHDITARGSADVIVYTDADGVITIDNGVYTRCEPGANSWLVAGSSIRLDQASGRGTARNVTLRVKDVPVLYVPWISFSIDDARATGFLAPVLGSTRDGGFDVATPYYLNLAPNYDATLTPRIQVERGVMLGAELRHLGRNSQQILDMQYLPDDALYDAATANQPDSDSPPVPDRWLLDYELLGRLGPNWTGAIDYAAVSDIDYFQDLGNNGLFSTTRSFLYRDARVRYQDPYWKLTAAAQAFQIIDPSVPPQSIPYRSLPRINLEGSNWLGSGLEYGIDGEFVVFDRDINPQRLTAAQIAAGALVTGSRLALVPGVSFPWANAGAFVTPTLKYKYAAWNLEDQAAGTSARPTRGIVTGSLDSGLIFERDAVVASEPYRQTLEPRLFYLYSEYEDQSTLPVFDSSAMTFGFNQLFRDDRFSGKDRVGDTNQLTLALTSRFFAASGQEKARASIGQIRYFEDRRVTLFAPPDRNERKAGSAIAGELAYQLATNWRATSYLQWDTQEDALEVANFQIQYQSDINHILNLGHRYRDDTGHLASNGFDRTINQTDVSAVWPVNDNWSMIGRWNYDHANKRNLEAIAGLEYANCCWTVRVIAREWIDNNALFFGSLDDSNTGVFIQFELKGLGSVIGGNVSGILQNGISGYRERDYAL
jgi:LPS-assembly protein